MNFWRKEKKYDLIIGTKQQLCKVNIDHLSVDGSKIKPVSAAKSLGTWFDSNLNLSEHINKTSRAEYFHLHNINRIRKYLSKASRQILIQALIIGRLDYCNSLLYGLPSVNLGKLQTGTEFCGENNLQNIKI